MATSSLEVRLLPVRNRTLLTMGVPYGRPAVGLGLFLAQLASKSTLSTLDVEKRGYFGPIEDE